MSRALALDLGSRRIGVAVSDGRRAMAFPRAVLERGAERAGDHRAIREIVVEEGVSTVVVGLPLSLDGHRGPAARAAAEEASELATALADLGVQVVTHDERLTTVSASVALSGAGKDARRQRGSIDSAAATILLEAWLATQGG